MQNNSETLQTLLTREKKAKQICANLNNFTELKPTLMTIIKHIKELTHCQAISIRLHDNGDYPYYVNNGFPDAFIKKENSLCSKDIHGNRIYDEREDRYELDCMCGNIIHGRFDSSLPFFSGNGSFWSNHTTALLASTSEADRQASTRNYCNSCGYESVALIPIKSKNVRIGLVQLNDKRTDMFERSLIEYIEMIAEQIGQAVENSYHFEKIAEQKTRLADSLEKLKMMQDQLVETRKMASLGNLVAGVAHEINTPVGVGITAVSTLLERNSVLGDLFSEKRLTQSDLENYFSFVDKIAGLILKNLSRTGDLIKNFKQVAVDQSVDELKRFEIKSWLKDIISTLEPMLKDQDVQVETGCGEHITINSYPGVFAQVLINLLMNSLLHAFSGINERKITIDVHVENSVVVLKYSDNGKGIPEDVLPDICDPFYTTNKKVGTGLGMHIVYNLVHQKLNGSLRCESKPGEGVEFTIEIPREVRR